MATDVGSAPPDPPDEGGPQPPSPAAGPPSTVASASPRTTHPRRRWPASARVTASLLGIALVASLVAGALVTVRLLDTNQRWQDSSAQWEALARKHGEQAAKATGEADQLQADLDETKRQLATAKKRITALAHEKAALGDKAATSQETSDYQSRVSQAAGTVATALDRCVDGERQLLTYVEHADQYDAADVARYRDDVEKLCAAATDANDALQSSLES